MKARSHAAGSGWGKVWEPTLATQARGSKEEVPGWNLETSEEFLSQHCWHGGLFFTDGTSEMQYGFFNRVVPGGSMGRSYTWQEVKDKVPAKLVYTDFDTSGKPTWNLPFPG